MQQNEPIGYKIVQLSRQIDRKINQNVSKYGITKMQSMIIKLLSEDSKKGDVFQKDIEERFDIRRSSVTSVLNLMETNGIIRRISSTTDRRLKKIVLQEKGIQLSDCVNRSIEEMEKELIEGVTQEELTAFFLLAEKLSKNLCGETKAKKQESKKAGEIV